MASSPNMFSHHLLTRLTLLPVTHRQEHRGPEAAIDTHKATQLVHTHKPEPGLGLNVLPVILGVPIALVTGYSSGHW